MKKTFKKITKLRSLFAAVACSFVLGSQAYADETPQMKFANDNINMTSINVTLAQAPYIDQKYALSVMPSGTFYEFGKRRLRADRTSFFRYGTYDEKFSISYNTYSDNSRNDLFKYDSAGTSPTFDFKERGGFSLKASFGVKCSKIRLNSFRCDHAVINDTTRIRIYFKANKRVENEISKREKYFAISIHGTF